MSDRPRVLLVGATGLIGRCVIYALLQRNEWNLAALCRREAPLPKGVHMEMRIADPLQWPEVIARTAPDSIICALGTTWTKAGRSEAEFRSVDQDMVLNVAKAACAAGARQFIVISSAGADARSKNFYLRVKGEVEQTLNRLNFQRIDCIRPGLLRGARSPERRFGERLAISLSPLSDLFCRGFARRYHSIKGEQVAHAALQLTCEKEAGRFVHEYDAICRQARNFEK
ncbi:NAD-dependent epimerase/dehydratase family protein [Altericroceibacterium spongiae]|uniref:NAD-dependent epimerase/dehydratase family protein n=1 Tax=Altericroceibacterium spongiae TaxID=2320269 RepID=A0A420EMW7_9SPHN|nr:NAD(P)H-binding protein [Altericroceibacterium spongiae]RKF21944.1 NAD-dependent epimerase/dehydratase family protein [Altericroceibacterium spongiae]